MVGNAIAKTYDEFKQGDAEKKGEIFAGVGLNVAAVGYAGYSLARLPKALMGARETAVAAEGVGATGAASVTFGTIKGLAKADDLVGAGGAIERLGMDGRTLRTTIPAELKTVTAAEGTTIAAKPVLGDVLDVGRGTKTSLGDLGTTPKLGAESVRLSLWDRLSGVKDRLTNWKPFESEPGLTLGRDRPMLDFTPPEGVTAEGTLGGRLGTAGDMRTVVNADRTIGGAQTFKPLTGEPAPLRTV